MFNEVARKRVYRVDVHLQGRDRASYSRDTLGGSLPIIVTLGITPGCLRRSSPSVYVRKLNVVILLAIILQNAFKIS